MALWVADPGPQTTLQDLGRSEYQRFGVPVSGPMDEVALQAANLLVGNPPAAAGLEFALRGPELLADSDCLVAVCGADSWLSVDRRKLPGWMGVRVRAGQKIQAVLGQNGAWGYLAVSGGLAAPPVLGSASTYLRGGFGGLDGRALQEGDWLASRSEGRFAGQYAGSRLREMGWLTVSQDIEVGVVPGPQEEWFGEAGLAVFFNSQFCILTESDRMGYRLEGVEVPRRKGEMLSEGMVMGSIQVPPSGQPIVMMADRPTTGGYPKIGTVMRADLPRLAQLRPGER